MFFMLYNSMFSYYLVPFWDVRYNFCEKNVWFDFFWGGGGGCMFHLCHLYLFSIRFQSKMMFAFFNSNIHGAISGAGTVYHFGALEFSPSFLCAQYLVFCVVFCRSSSFRSPLHLEVQFPLRCRWLFFFVLFLLVVILSVLQYTAFDIFKVFL